MNRLLLALVALCVVACAGAHAAEANHRSQAQKAYNNGNYKDAYSVFSKLATSAETDPKKVGSDLQMALNCLNNLGRTSEVDVVRDAPAFFIHSVSSLVKCRKCNNPKSLMRVSSIAIFRRPVNFATCTSPASVICVLDIQSTCRSVNAARCGKAASVT
jgi:hypothetical protein